ncbi:copper resistance CopC family protein [Nocardioides sp. URHA0032]|uniref:copper resistance CopC family protein n=1 Tax=Nocardioides sp. URHA0032 TaxID=1380388 RepID=UPI0006849E85|nr:copper resistance protein CopC [Nocardioides sp. URHA0032]
MADRRLAGAVLAAATLLLVVAPAAPVDAHATAVAAWPAPGQVLVSAPDRITIEFSNDVEPQVDVAVVDPSGQSLMIGDPVVEGRYVTQELRGSDAVGGYVAAFHAVAVDLHPIIARIDYTVDPDATATTNPAGDPPDLAAVAAEPTSADEGGNQLPALLLLVGVGVLVGVTVLHLVSRRTVSARR